jgi:hypothetical protein
MLEPATKQDIQRLENKIDNVVQAISGSELNENGIIPRIKKIETWKESIQNFKLYTTGYVLGVSFIVVLLYEVAKDYFKH